MPSTNEPKAITLADIEKAVAKAIRFRGASPDGENAIRIADRIIAAVGVALNAPHAVTGARTKVEKKDSFNANEVGIYGTSIVGNAAHKYAFDVRLVGAHDIDVSTTFYLLPRNDGSWFYDLDFVGRGIAFAGNPLDENVDVHAPLIRALVERLHAAAVAQARTRSGIR